MFFLRCSSSFFRVRFFYSRERIEMLVDEDDLCQDLPDNSYGYTPNRKRAMHGLGERNLIDDEGPFIVEACETKNTASMDSSFLRSHLNAGSSESFAVETANRAGCSREGVEMMRRMDVGPSEIDDMVNKLDKADGDRLSSQLNKELVTEWKSTSLVRALSVDDSGVVDGNSLLQTYDLLCNINLQLIVMQRELLKHKNIIIQLRGSELKRMSGYEDSQNKEQLRRLLHSLTSASQGLQNRIADLKCAVLGDSSPSKITADSFSVRAFIITCLGILCVGSLMRRSRIFDFLKAS